MSEELHQMLPMFAPGVLGSQRSRDALQWLAKSYSASPLDIEMRVATLAAAWEGHHALALHGTGLPLMGQGDDLVDLGAIWARWRRDRVMRDVLAGALHMGQGRALTRPMHDRLARTLGAWFEPWQDVIVFAAWVERLYVTHADRIPPSGDERLEEWLAKVVQARHALTGGVASYAAVVVGAQ